MRKWKRKSKADKKAIRRFYLKFYKSFSTNSCPANIAYGELGDRAAEALFYEDLHAVECRMCENFTILTKGRSSPGCCPCVEFEADEAKNRLKKLLKAWRIFPWPRRR